jgi:hypothetical protein
VSGRPLVVAIIIIIIIIIVRVSLSLCIWKSIIIRHQERDGTAFLPQLQKDIIDYRL